MDMNTGGEEWEVEERVGEAGWGVGKRKEDTHTSTRNNDTYILNSAIIGIEICLIKQNI